MADALGPPKQLADGGTKLYLRTDPPRNNATQYADDEPKTFKGYVVLGMGVPRWMSSHFAVVLGEQNLPEANLDLYSQDWMEKILYIPADQLPEQNVDLQSDIADFAKNVITVSVAAQHQLSSGCQRVSPRATIQAVGASIAAVDSTDYYAVVSKSDAKDPVYMDEITIATMANRAKFAASAMHKAALDLALQLRARNAGLPILIQQRTQLFKALAGLPGTFQP